jgi:hypothetical protein
MEEAPLVGSVRLSGEDAQAVIVALRNSPPFELKMRCPAPNTWEMWRIRYEDGHEVTLLAEVAPCEHVSDGARGLCMPPMAHGGLAPYES